MDCAFPNVGSSHMRRLTHVEYDNAVSELLGDTSAPASSFPPDTKSGFFNNTATVQTVPGLLAEGYLNTAAQLAQNANIPALLGCDAAAADCVAGFIQSFARRAYRRPLDQTEAQSLQAVYDRVLPEADAETAVRAVVAAVLTAPQFLYYFEGAGPDTVTAGVKQLTQFEIAARLGSLLWSSLPDDALLDAAAAGQLATPEQVGAQAQRMLDDPRARTATNVVYEQWFGLERLEQATKDTELFPEYTDGLRQAMREETRRFVDHVIWEGDATLATLLTAPYSFVNAELAPIYGVNAAGDTFEQVSLNPAERAGIMTQASFLSGYSSVDESSPFLRGAWLRTRLLCQNLPSPPADVPELPELEEGISNRERAAQHSAAPACGACHSMIDGLGFGFEQYDALGRTRTVDNGVPVDTSGEVTSTTDADGPFNGGVELANRFAQSAQVRDCAPTQWMRYAMARPEAVQDTCSLQQLKDSFAASGGNLKQLVVALTQTDAFLHYRRPD